MLQQVEVEGQQCMLEILDTAGTVSKLLLLCIFFYFTLLLLKTNRINTGVHILAPPLFFGSTDLNDSALKCPKNSLLGSKILSVEQFFLNRTHLYSANES